MRRLGFLLIGAAASLSAAPAQAQQATPARPPAAAPASPVTPPEEPAYEPSAHAGLSEGAWLRMTRGTGRRSTGMMATGIVFVGLGAVFMGTGTGIYASRASCDNTPILTGDGSTFTRDCPQSGPHTGGMAMLLAGSIGVALGLPLWILGGSDVPWAEAARLHTPSRPAWAAAAPALVAAPGTSAGAGLAWTF
jgi:hypothetical protein